MNKTYDRVVDSACDQIVESIYQVEDYTAEIQVIDQSLEALSDQAFVEKNRSDILHDYGIMSEEYTKRIPIIENEIAQIEADMHDYRVQDDTRTGEEEELRNLSKLIRNGMMGGLVIGIAVLLITIIIQVVRQSFMGLTMGNIILLTLIYEGICYLNYTRVSDRIQMVEKRNSQALEADAKWKNQLQNEKNQLALYKSKAAMGSLETIEEIQQSLIQQREQVEGYIVFNKEIQETFKQKIRSVIELNPESEVYIQNLLRTYEDKFII